MNQRQQACLSWLQDQLPSATSHQCLQGDASFRTYSRVCAGDQSYILMDVPPEKESCDAFIAIANAFRTLGLRTPEIYHADVERGFLLISDLGDRLLLNLLNSETVDGYYQTAFKHLQTIQTCQTVDAYPLPLFDERTVQYELQLFRDWYLQRHLGLELSRSELYYLDQMNAQLTEAVLAQPQVCVHRDYHSRNLMVLENDEFGILDFQDAVWGPITYDLMSLLRDCYIAWPYDRVQAWVMAYRERVLEQGILKQDDPEQFLRWCDWIALQRHLKCIGIFSRLNYRDDKPGYLKDIPRVVAYAKLLCQRYPEFAGLEKFLQVKL